MKGKKMHKSKRAEFVVHTRTVQGFNLQENNSDGSQDTADKAHCSSSKLPLITDRSKLMVEHAWRVRDHFNGN
jgi:hypothetical protein